MADKTPIQVRLPGAAAPQASSGAPSIRIKGQVSNLNPTAQVDLVFVIDTTGSMSDKIAAILRTCSSFVDDFAALGLDSRLGLVAFGDLTVPGDRIDVFPFTHDIDAFRQQLMQVTRFSGGGNEGESAVEALESILGLEFRHGAVKAAVLITDEPALGGSERVTLVADRLRSQEILTYALTPSLRYYQEIAAKTGGHWAVITASADLTALLQLFQELAGRVSKVVADVHRLAGGSVSRYLQLPKGG